MGITTVSKILDILNKHGGECDKATFRREVIEHIGSGRRCEKNMNDTITAMIETSILYKNGDILGVVK